MRLTALVLGSINLDSIYDCATMLKPGAAGCSTLASTIHGPLPGGKGLNQSLALWRAGADVRLLGRVGVEGLNFGLQAFSRAVDGRTLPMDDVVVAPNEHTGQCHILHHEGREYAAIFHPGANTCHTLEGVSAFLEKHSTPEAAGVSVFYVQGETNMQAEALAAARERGANVLLYNPSHRADADWNMVRPVHIDWLVVNEEEAKVIIRETSAAAFKYTDLSMESLAESVPSNVMDVLHTLAEISGAQNIVLTLGKLGSVALLTANDIPIYVPRFNVPDVVDTSGAGDAFVGYFTAALYSDDWEDVMGAAGPVPRLGADGAAPLTPERVGAAMRIGTAAAAIVVMRLGPEPPEAAEVREFLQKPLVIKY